MAFKKGHKKVGGRAKGVPNKTTVIAKEAIEDAFLHLQTKTEERKDLRQWAEDNTDRFYEALFPKIIPHQVNHGGHDGGRLVITWQTTNAE